MYYQMCNNEAGVVNNVNHNNDTSSNNANGL